MRSQKPWRSVGRVKALAIGGRNSFRVAGSRGVEGCAGTSPGLHKTIRGLALRLGRFGDWLMPASCVLCGAAASSREVEPRGIRLTKREVLTRRASSFGSANLCDSCAWTLPRPGAGCAVCVTPMPASGWCARCLERRPAFERAIAGLLYRPPVDGLVTRFKYRGHLASGLTLGDALARSVAASLVARPVSTWPVCMVPTPLHGARLRSRGFNQSRLIAERVGALIGIEVSNHYCYRHLDTEPQSSLSGVAARQRNVRNAFCVTPLVKGLRIAIVDDVMTTGATANALARAALAAGASAVEVWASARAPSPTQTNPQRRSL